MASGPLRIVLIALLLYMFVLGLKSKSLFLGLILRELLAISFLVSSVFRDFEAIVWWSRPFLILSCFLWLSMSIVDSNAREKDCWPLCLTSQLAKFLCISSNCVYHFRYTSWNSWARSIPFFDMIVKSWLILPQINRIPSSISLSYSSYIAKFVSSWIILPSEWVELLSLPSCWF